MKTVDFLETIAANDLKIGISRQLIQLMKVGIRGHSISLHWPKVIYISKLKLVFLRNHLANLKQFLCKL